MAYIVGKGANFVSFKQYETEQAICSLCTPAELQLCVKSVLNLYTFGSQRGHIRFWEDLPFFSSCHIKLGPAASVLCYRKTLLL